MGMADSEVGIAAAGGHGAPETAGEWHRARAGVVVVGAGAAGLMASVWAGSTLEDRAREVGVVALDGAKTLGAKILVAGGGRCNVTHDVVDVSAYNGSSANAIRKVLRSFDVPRTIEFFRDLGVELKREETGKLFPTTDRARTVLNALLQGVHMSGARVLNPRRVEGVERGAACFRVYGDWGEIGAERVVLATGGMALPRSGSDGQGYAIARSLGHTVTPAVFPALVPLVVEPPHFIRDLSGVTLRATVEVRSSSGKKLAEFTDSTLLTHFGLSGPSVLDASRHLTAARLEDAGAHVVLNFIPGATFDSFERELTALGNRSVVSVLRERLPARLAEALLREAGVHSAATGATLTKEARRTLIRHTVEQRPNVTGDRGFTHAEVTAGGVPLSEVRLETMESRVCPGLHLCGEVLDVDGRIGGFNFQWAWSSGYVAGRGAATGLTGSRSEAH